VHLAEHQSNRPSVRCKRRSAAIIVSRHTRGNVIGLTDIEAIVRTPNDVDEPHGTTMPSSQRRFNQELKSSPSTRFARSGHSPHQWLAMSESRMGLGSKSGPFDSLSSVARSGHSPCHGSP
jgi:hypothetical protein